MVERVDTPIRDRSERLRALDPRASIIVQAPAGSGKTELLIQRFLTLLAGVDQPESIVALTFTRKAAGEMRHRVIGALESASGPEPQSDHERQTWTLAARALARDEQQGWRLLEHPSRLRIQTIDSLCGSLVRGMPWVSRMGAPPRPEENVDHLYRKAAHETLQLLDSGGAHADVLARLLAHLDNDVRAVEELFGAMLARRDQWLRHVVPNAGSAEFGGVLASALTGIVTDELEELVTLFPEDIVAETLILARFAAANLGEEEADSPLIACLDLGSLPGSDWTSLGPWLGLAEMFLTRNGERRRQPDKRQGFPPTKQGKAAKRRFKAIPLDDRLIAKLGALRSLPPLVLDERQGEILSGLMALLPVAAAQLLLVFGREGMVDFTEIAMAARTALGPPEDPTDLAFALDCRIGHLLVDEFQDTSQSQYELLVRLTEEWQEGDGRTLFLVGDPMQSIYAFRKAEVALFLKARKEGIGNVRLVPLRLSVNFRSSPAIVEWVNRGLGPAFPDLEDMFAGAVTYEPSVAFAPETEAAAEAKAVTVHPFFEGSLEPEAMRVLDVIKEARAVDPQGSIAVLVRARSDLFAVVRSLRRAGEKFRAVEIDALGERPVVRDLAALTRAMLHPGDRVAWLSILRAPWCGLTLADLDALVAGDFASSIWDLVDDPGRLASMSPDGSARLVRVRGILADALPRIGTMPIRRWVEATWVSLGGPACLGSRTDLEDAAAYLDLLEESAAGADLEDERKFIDDVARLFARPDVEAPNVGEPGELQLLTIHKAKGLEFDTVILPGLGRGTRHEEPSLMMWLEYIDRRGASQLLMAPIGETGGDEDPLYAYLRRVGSKKAEHESTRLLYVAATRARKRLHLMGHTGIEAGAGHVRVPGKRTLLRKIWGVVEPEFESALRMDGDVVGTSAVEAGDEGMDEPIGVPLRRLGRDWTQPPLRADIDWKPDVAASGAADEVEEVSLHPTFDWAGELGRRVGIVVHALLGRTSVEGFEGWDAGTIRAALVSEGLAGDTLIEAARRIEQALEATARDERGRWVLADHEDDQREYALSTLIGGRPRRVVLDRTFIDGDVRWIIDYKTGTHGGGGVDAFLDNEQARYRAQLEGYAGAMRHIDPGPIRLGLYFPMLQGWREWAFEG